LLASAIARLAPGGVIWFSCNLREFQLDISQIEKHRVVVDDWTKRTTPPDFRGTPHHCFRLQRSGR
jgi:23S rRNA G2069 N7-methylase RlmK/C1962 C5-methylase RlmI